MIKIEGFREEMHETREHVMRATPNLTLPEATTAAAKYHLVSIMVEKGGTLPNDISEEILRRIGLIELSGARRTAKLKLGRHLENS